MSQLDQKLTVILCYIRNSRMRLPGLHDTLPVSREKINKLNEIQEILFFKKSKGSIVICEIFNIAQFLILFKQIVIIGCDFRNTSSSLSRVARPEEGGTGLIKLSI